MEALFTTFQTQSRRRKNRKIIWWTQNMLLIIKIYIFFFRLWEYFLLGSWWCQENIWSTYSVAKIKARFARSGKLNYQEAKIRKNVVHNCTLKIVFLVIGRLSKVKGGGGQKYIFLDNLKTGRNSFSWQE